jgi:hypothetical protein
MAVQESGQYTTLEVTNLKETRRALRNAGKDVRRDIRQQLKSVGEIVSTEAQAIASAEGLYRTGKLVRSIKPSASSMTVKIRATAKRKSRKYPTGFNYPRVYEFGGATHRSNGKGGLSPIRNRSKKGAALARLGKGPTAVHGPRAFMKPALDKRREEVLTKFRGVLESVGVKFKNG